MQNTEMRECQQRMKSSNDQDHNPIVGELYLYKFEEHTEHLGFNKALTVGNNYTPFFLYTVP